jgi:hypothetical protein
MTRVGGTLEVDTLEVGTLGVGTLGVGTTAEAVEVAEEIAEVVVEISNERRGF